LNNYQLAADALQKELLRMRGLAEARDFLERVGSLEQAASEISGRVDVLKKEETKLRSAVTDAETKLAAAKTAAAAAAKEMADTRDSIIAKANTAAAEIIATAEMKAADTVAEAERRKAEMAQRAQRLSEAVRAVQ
jgi:hypothetical protein